jgi:hypothetical protein
MAQKHEDQQELQVMVWYRKEDWDSLRELFSDAHLLPENYDRWQQMAESKVREVEQSGDLVAKVTIDTNHFPAWCREKGCAMDSEARTSFAIETIQKQQFLNNM